MRCRSTRVVALLLLLLPEASNGDADDADAAANAAATKMTPRAPKSRCDDNISAVFVSSSSFSERGSVNVEFLEQNGIV